MSILVSLRYLLVFWGDNDPVDPRDDQMVCSCFHHLELAKHFYTLHTSIDEVFLGVTSVVNPTHTLNVVPCPGEDVLMGNVTS